MRREAVGRGGLELLEREFESLLVVFLVEVDAEMVDEDSSVFVEQENMRFARFAADGRSCGSGEALS
ncbi:MAG: hypothetical protein QOH12_1396 [Solirubrobacteraceae bacterium]|nr:hypothetical protein [Solirubrobacteraceae bacterium]